ncbi:MAG: SDR family oxidoreductase [Sphingobium sp.]
MSADEPPYRPLGHPRQQSAAGEGARALSHRRLALVTGGHRRLGGVIAAALAEAGFSLALHGSHDTRLDSSLALALEANDTEWDGFVADFRDPETAEELVAQVSARFGRPPDLLVNSAAMFGQDRLDTVTATDLTSHFAVNCAAPALLTKAFATVPAGPGDRCIVNILDQRIAHPHRDQLSYTLSKMALAGLTRLTASTLAPHVRVNAVAPGLTIATADYETEQLDRLSAAMPLARLPRADQIAQAVLFLADADAVTGQTLHVDGGAHMRSYDRDFMHLAR